MLSPSPDPGTTDKVLASGFNAMLSHESPASFNNTVTPLLAFLSTPSTAVRWINALFFVSLVLSLAAALFGILAKQWLREYMQWDSPLGAPRENVLVRQMRIEAWEAWNVAATIASIPALLELAMVQFLIGIVILLWTLDDVVATVVTVVTLLFLFIVSTFTILPIFNKRCPYKSPTAWACLIAFSFLVYMFQSAVSLLVSMDKTPFPKSWRDRDLGTRAVTKIHAATWWPTYEDARTAAKRELARENRNLSAGGELLASAGLNLWNDNDADALLRNIGEIAFLIRALSWVECASQDTRMHAYISQSLSFIHTDMHGVLPRDVQNIRAVTLWSLISSLRRNVFTSPHLALCEVDPDDSLQTSTTITSLRQELGVTLNGVVNFPYADKSPFTWPISPYTTILRRLLLSTTEASISKSDWHLAETVIRRICESIGLWHGYFPPGRSKCWQLRILHSMLRSRAWDETHRLAPELSDFILKVALRNGKLTMDDEGKHLSMEVSPGTR
jgi:hypothetical protein